MSFLGRLRSIVSDLFSSPEVPPQSELPKEPGEVIKDWLTPGNGGGGQDTPGPDRSDHSIPADIADLGAWESGLYADYVPEDLWDNPELLDNFNRGFGREQHGSSFADIQQARIDFLRELEAEGIFIDQGDFWKDWRDEYENAA